MTKSKGKNSLGHYEKGTIINYGPITDSFSSLAQLANIMHNANFSYEGVFNVPNGLALKAERYRTSEPGAINTGLAVPADQAGIVPDTGGPIRPSLPYIFNSSVIPVSLKGKDYGLAAPIGLRLSNLVLSDGNSRVKIMETVNSLEAKLEKGKLFIPLGKRFSDAGLVLYLTKNDGR